MKRAKRFFLRGSFTPSFTFMISQAYGMCFCIPEQPFLLPLFCPKTSLMISVERFVFQYLLEEKTFTVVLFLCVRKELKTWKIQWFLASFFSTLSWKEPVSEIMSSFFREMVVINVLGNLKKRGTNKEMKDCEKKEGRWKRGMKWKGIEKQVKGEKEERKEMKIIDCVILLQMKKWRKAKESVLLEILKWVPSLLVTSSVTDSYIRLLFLHSLLGIKESGMDRRKKEKFRKKIRNERRDNLEWVKKWSVRSRDEFDEGNRRITMKEIAG